MFSSSHSKTMSSTISSFSLCLSISNNSGFSHPSNTHFNVFQSNLLPYSSLNHRKEGSWASKDRRECFNQNLFRDAVWQSVEQRYSLQLNQIQIEWSLLEQNSHFRFDLRKRFFAAQHLNFKVNHLLTGHSLVVEMAGVIVPVLLRVQRSVDLLILNDVFHHNT